MNRVIIMLSCCLLLASCSKKEIFTGKWVNLDDSLSVNSSKPVYFEAIWYLVQNNQNLCAVSTAEVQNKLWGDEEIYYGLIINDKAILNKIKYKNNDEITIDDQSDSITITVNENKLSMDRDPKRVHEFVNNSIEKIINKNNSVQLICKKNENCKEIHKCERIFNHFQNKESLPR